MYKGPIVILLLFCQALQAQHYSTPDIGRSSGKIQLEHYTIHFDYQQQHLAYLCITDKNNFQKKRMEAWFSGNLLSSVKTFYADGKPRSELNIHNTGNAYHDLASYQKLRVYREPVLNLPFKYFLDGHSKYWNPDGNICTIAWYRNEQWIADSINVGGHNYAMAELNARTHDFVLQDWLYDPALLGELLQETEKIKLPADTSARLKVRFNPNDYIHNGLVYDQEKERKMRSHKTFSRLLEKYHKKGELISFSVHYSGRKINQISVNSEAVTYKDKSLLIGHLLQVLSTTGIKVNNMVADNGEVSFYFHMGC